MLVYEWAQEQYLDNSCPYCLVPFVDKGVAIAHTEGEQHPIHLICALLIERFRNEEYVPTCITCRQVVNLTSIYKLYNELIATQPALKEELQKAIMEIERERSERATPTPTLFWNGHFYRWIIISSYILAPALVTAKIFPIIIESKVSPVAITAAFIQGMILGGIWVPMGKFLFGWNREEISSTTTNCFLLFLAATAGINVFFRMMPPPPDSLYTDMAKEFCLVLLTTVVGVLPGCHLAATYFRRWVQQERG